MGYRKGHGEHKVTWHPGTKRDDPAISGRRKLDKDRLRDLKASPDYTIESPLDPLWARLYAVPVSDHIDEDVRQDLAVALLTKDVTEGTLDQKRRELRGTYLQSTYTEVSFDVPLVNTKSGEAFDDKWALIPAAWGDMPPVRQKFRSAVPRLRTNPWLGLPGTCEWCTAIFHQRYRHKLMRFCSRTCANRSQARRVCVWPRVGWAELLPRRCILPASHILCAACGKGRWTHRAEQKFCSVYCVNSNYKHWEHGYQCEGMNRTGTGHGKNKGKRCARRGGQPGYRCDWHREEGFRHQVVWNTPRVRKMFLEFIGVRAA